LCARHRTFTEESAKRRCANRGRGSIGGETGTVRSNDFFPERSKIPRNLDEVTTNGDYEVTFHLKRPQPAFIALLASGFSPVYPCHVPPREAPASDQFGCATARSGSNDIDTYHRSGLYSLSLQSGLVSQAGCRRRGKFGATGLKPVNGQSSPT